MIVPVGTLEHLVDEPAIVIEGFIVVKESEKCCHNLLYFYGFDIFLCKNTKII